LMSGKFRTTPATITPTATTHKALGKLISLLFLHALGH
jgi:hypothetical protein